LALAAAVFASITARCPLRPGGKRTASFHRRLDLDPHGVTEPIEVHFIFLEPVLYAVHAATTVWALIIME